METERIALSQRERERLRVLHEVKEKHLTQVEAAKRLNPPGKLVKITDFRGKRIAVGCDPLCNFGRE